ncbi:sulfotransferase family 2 domain-containing protein [Ascidiaceihabitans sp.]|uniref:sulfotransferase family 2 domain-containing protein n=1 Tax=Ascidiaceihabitans sp. TaxID=1872644 RepID=UPI003298D720
MIRVEAHKIAYMALPKAACSSVKKALAMIDPAVDVESLPETKYEYDKWHSVYPTQKFRTYRWQRNIEKDWFGFAVVRDPVKRLMACYTNRVVERGELKNSRNLKNGTYNLPVEPDPDFFFQNIDTYRKAASSIKHHAMHTWLFTGPDLSAFTKVYTTEKMADLVRDVQDWTNVPFEIGRENTSSMRLTLDDLKPETVKALTPWLCLEYGFLINHYSKRPAQLQAF